jgi:hypothetical protein
MAGSKTKPALSEKDIEILSEYGAIPKGPSGSEALSKDLKPKSPDEQGILNQAFMAAESGAETLAKPAMWALEKAAPVLEEINKYGANPIRKGVATLQEGGGLLDALSAAGEQFGSDTPVISGKEMVAKEGLSTKSLSERFPEMFSETGVGMKLKKGGLLDVSPAGVVGGAGEALLDPMSYVGAGTAYKGGKEALKAGRALKTAAGGLIDEGKGLVGKLRALPGEAKELSRRGKGLLEEESLIDNVSKKLESVKSPDVMEKVAKKVSEAESKMGELVQQDYKTLDALEKRLPDLEYPLLKGQKEMLKDSANRDLIKTYLESPDPEAEQFRKYQLAQKNEVLSKLDGAIKSVSPNIEPDLTVRGEKLIDTLSDKYVSNKELAGAFFNDLDDIPVPPIEGGNKLIEKISDKLGLKKFIKDEAFDDAPNAVMLKKLPEYSRDMGISKNTHSLINEITGLVSKKELSIKDLRRIRESLRNEINPSMSKPDVAEIQKLRAAMLDHIEDIAGTEMPQARALFKEYATNESALDQLESVLGGKLDDKFQITKNTKPEQVLDRMFANTNNVKLAKQYLGDDAFNEIRANYLQQLKDKATVKGAFSAQKFRSLTDKPTVRAVLKESFADAPNVVQRVNDLADFMRLVPDLPTSNPSGTAKTGRIIGLIKGAGKLTKEPIKTLAETVENRATKKKAKGLLLGE